MNLLEKIFNILASVYGLIVFPMLGYLSFFALFMSGEPGSIFGVLFLVQCAVVAPFCAILWLVSLVVGL